MTLSCHFLCLAKLSFPVIVKLKKITLTNHIKVAKLPAMRPLTWIKSHELHTTLIAGFWGLCGIC